MEREEESPEPIYLNVYSLGGWNCVLNAFGIGVFHTGVEVYKTEYWYGGHKFNYTGIMRSKPQSLSLHMEERLLVGYTCMSQQEVQKETDFLDAFWIGSEYEAFSHNCNNFSKEFIWRIGNSKVFPDYINRFADMKPLFRIWFTPLQFLFGDIVRVTNAPAPVPDKASNIDAQEGYKTRDITTEIDFQSVKDEADLHFMVNSYAKALIGYKMCLNSTEHCVESYVLQQVFIAAANCSAKLGQYSDMEDYCTRCTVRFPNFATGYLKRAVARRFLKRYAGARSDLNRAHELAPNDIRVAEEMRRLTKSLPLPN